MADGLLSEFILKGKPEVLLRTLLDLTQLPFSVVHLYSMQIAEQLQCLADWLTTHSPRSGAGGRRSVARCYHF